MVEINEKEIRYFSMFTGVGGFELGLENTRSKSYLSEGWNKNFRSTQNLQSKWNKSSNEKSSNNFRCIGFSEIDKYANQLLANKFPEVKNYGDATKINPNELPDFDMLCGGFPCQSFSIAGKRRGFEDTRGTMFFEIARILEVKRPRLVFLENVKGLLNHDEGKTFSVIIQTLEELGYEIQWMVLNSKFFGVPQNRERVFIIGNFRGEPRPEILPFRESNKNIIQSEGKIKMTNKSGSEIKRVYCPEGISPSLHLKSGGWQEPKISPTLSLELAHSLGYNFQKNLPLIGKIRRLTPIECERLQGFPDGWTSGFSDTQRYKMMGNAVTTNVIKAIGESMLK
jgi:DNA (cytosine-5)-methyltransferase 1